MTYKANVVILVLALPSASPLYMGLMATDNKQLVLDNLRKDLVFQLETAEDLDWNYFVETALKAKLIADNANVNMVEHERSIEEIISDAKSFTEEFVTSGMMPGGNLKRTILKYGL